MPPINDERGSLTIVRRYLEDTNRECLSACQSIMLYLLKLRDLNSSAIVIVSI